MPYSVGYELSVRRNLPSWSYPERACAAEADVVRNHSIRLNLSVSCGYNQQAIAKRLAIIHWELNRESDHKRRYVGQD